MTAAPVRPDSVRGAATRRSATVGALMAAALAGTTDRADATAYAPRRRGKDQLLPKADRHLVSRFSYGITPKLAKDVRRVGGAQAWFERQLRPKAIKDKPADKLAHWWPSLRRPPGELWYRQSEGIEGGWEAMDDYARYVLMRRMTSKRQLLEVVTEFGRTTCAGSSRTTATAPITGTANVMFLAGAGVRGGYHARWPGLSGTYDSDLTVTTDCRQVLADVVSRRFNASVAQVFPGLKWQSTGVML